MSISDFNQLVHGVECCFLLVELSAQRVHEFAVLELLVLGLDFALFAKDQRILRLRVGVLRKTLKIVIQS